MATPHLDPVIFEPLWNANSLGSFVRQHSTHYTGAGQRDDTRVAGQVVTGIGFVCAAFISCERSSLRGVSTAASLFMCGAIGITLAYRFLTEATAAPVITLDHSRLPPPWTRSTFGGGR